MPGLKVINYEFKAAEEFYTTATITPDYAGITIVIHGFMGY